MARLLAAIAALVSVPSAALAGTGALRYTTVFTEIIDGTKQAESAAEQGVTAELVRAGVVFIDEARSRQIRGTTDAGQLIDGAIPQAITTLDADIIIAGVARTTRVESKLLGSKVARYEATLRAKVIAVANAQVLGVFTVHGSGMEVGAPAEAAESAAENAGLALAKEILAKVPTEPARRRLELVVTGIEDVSAAERIAEAVGHIPGVAAVTVLHAGRGESKLSVETSEIDARALAVALDRSAGAGLRVYGYNDRVIRADFSPGRSQRWRLVLGEFEAKGAPRKHDGLRTMLPASLGAVLGTSDRLDLALGGQVAALKKSRSGKIQPPPQLGKDTGALFLVGSYRAADRSILVEARISTARGAVLLSGQRQCAPAEMSACTTSLGEALAQDLPSKLAVKADLVPARSAGAPGDRPGTRKPLEILSVEVEDVFPSLLNRYRTSPVGRLRVRNRGSSTLVAVELTTQLLRYMTGTRQQTVPDIPAGRTAELPIYVSLDESVLASHDTEASATLAVSVRYRDAELEFHERRSMPAIVHGRTALRCCSPAAPLASFVTPRESDVVRYARAARAAIPSDAEDDPLAVPAALFELLVARGIRYAPDPANPFGKTNLDYVQYPVETLRERAGDCDDLAVAYAALASAIDVPALLVASPGHVFVAVAAGVPDRGATAVWPAADNLLLYDHQAWVPIETTRIAGSFGEAWESAAQQIHKLRDSGRTPEIIDLRAAWQEFPPVSLVARAVALPGPEIPALEARVRAAMDDVRGRRVREIERRLAALVREPPGGQLENKRGVLLFFAGRLHEARVAFETSLKASGPRLEALTNLANLELVEGHPKEALEVYARGMRDAPRDRRVLFNASVAALVLGDLESLGRYVATLATLGAEAEADIVELTRLDPPAGGGRGAAVGDPEVRSKQSGDEPIRRAYRHLYWL